MNTKQLVILIITILVGCTTIYAQQETYRGTLKEYITALARPHIVSEDEELAEKFIQQYIDQKEETIDSLLPYYKESVKEEELRELINLYATPEGRDFLLNIDRIRSMGSDENMFNQIHDYIYADFLSRYFSSEIISQYNTQLSRKNSLIQKTPDHKSSYSEKYNKSWQIFYQEYEPTIMEDFYNHLSRQFKIETGYQIRFKEKTKNTDNKITQKIRNLMLLYSGYVFNDESMEYAASVVSKPSFKAANKMSEETDRFIMKLRSDYSEHLNQQNFNTLLATAKAGDAQAQYQVGLAYLKGTNVDVNNAVGYAWISAAAEQGVPDALFLLGNFYINGIVVETDKEQAFIYYLKAAEHGHLEGMNKVSQMYKNGEGTEKDSQKAKYWKKKYEVLK